MFNPLKNAGSCKNIVILKNYEYKFIYIYISRLSSIIILLHDISFIPRYSIRFSTDRFIFPVMTLRNFFDLTKYISFLYCLHIFNLNLTIILFGSRPSYRTKKKKYS